MARKMVAFGKPVALLEGVDERRIAQEHQDRRYTEYTYRFMDDLCEAMTTYMQFGVYQNVGKSESGLLYPVEAGNAILALEDAIPGVYSPDKTPFFFDRRIDRPAIEPGSDKAPLTPDLSWLEWMTSSNMEGSDIEYRDEWDASVQFVLIKEAGQIIYQKMSGQRKQMTVDEYGAGFAAKWRWLETNRFIQSLERMAPLFKFEFFEGIARQVYTLLQTAVTTTITGGNTNVLVADINTAIRELKRSLSFSGRKRWANARFRIIARDEMWDYLDAAYNVGQTMVERGTNAIRLQNRPPITFTENLDPAFPYRFYVVVDNWMESEYATSVPLTVHGPVDDIDTFAKKLAYRAVYGASLPSDFGRVITVDPTNVSFRISRPVDVNMV